MFRFQDGSEIVIRDTAVVGGATIHVQRKVIPKRQAGADLQSRKAGAYEWIIGKPHGEAGKVTIQPLMPEKNVYLECERKDEGDLERVLFFGREA